MSHFSLISYIYAAILVVGGVIGYVKGKSNVSLIAGLASAVVAGVAASIAPHHPRAGEGLGGLLAVCMIGTFSSRYRKTKNPMPAMPMIAISVLYLAATVYEIITGMGKG